MAKIVITVEVPDEYADPDDDTGLTQDGFDRLHDALAAEGYTDVQIDAQ